MTLAQVYIFTTIYSISSCSFVHDTLKGINEIFFHLYYKGGGLEKKTPYILTEHKYNFVD